MILSTTEVNELKPVIAKYIDAHTGLREDVMQTVLLELLTVEPTGNRLSFIKTVARNVALETVANKRTGPWGVIWKVGGGQQMLSLDELSDQGFQITTEGVVATTGTQWSVVGRKGFHKETH